MAFIATLFSAQLVLPEANAQTGINYTLTLPFERIFEEKGSFKPPVKLTKSDISAVLKVSCGTYVGERPEVLIRLASGKSISSVNMRASHKFNLSRWSKDGYGENVFTFRGTCVYVGAIPRNLPPSNFYQFKAYASESYLASSWSYPYTMKDLRSMKGGIRESRSMNSTVSSGTFTPIPELETPTVQVLTCVEGRLFKEGEDSEGEVVKVAYFAISNGIYRPERREFTSPSIEQFGNRQLSGEDYSLEFESLNRVETITENTPTFITWRFPSETKFVTNLRSMYKVWGISEIPDTAKEKVFDVEITADCKGAKTISR
jgi:hypothetical protein